MSLRSSLLFVILSSFWPCWQWYLARTFDASDEPWGLVALGSAAGIMFFCRSKSAPPSGLSAQPAIYLLYVCQLGYMISVVFCPHLVQAIFMVLILWLLMLPCMHLPSRTGIMGLLLLSLPAVSSLNFFAGYPLRLLITSGAASILGVAGLSVERQGTILVLNQQLISVDAPCSGVNMLWAAAYLALVFMCLCRLNLLRSIVLALIALLMVIAANILRVCGLSYFAVRSYSLAPQIQQAEPFIHLSAGLTAFILLAVGIAWLALMLRPKKQNDTVLPAGAAPTPVVFPGLQHMILLAVLSLLAGIEPFLCRQPSLPEPSLSVKWPEKINGIKMRPVANVPNDSLFEERFPGQAKQFTDGINSYLIRWVRSATRQLHPGSDCFRGMGYTIEFGPLVDMPGGTRWSSFTAVKGGARLKVLERICDEKGRSWTDVSAWYWSACSGTTKGPWWDIVIARKL